jgi:hypothetical protein
MRYICEKCRRAYELGPETMLFVFRAEPESSIMRTVCPGCENAIFVWHVPPNVAGHIRLHNPFVKLAYADKPPSELVRARLHQSGWRSRLNADERRLLGFYIHLMSCGQPADRTWPDREDLPNGRLSGAWPGPDEMTWLRLMCIYRQEGEGNA